MLMNDFIRIATRSSGIKQHDYGNIEKIVVKIKVVTSIGTFDKACTPRSSMGPEIENLMFGSEGTLGIVTEAVIRVHKKPEVKQYGSLLFPTFQQGINFMKECVSRKCLPSSLRLVDNYQVKFGLAVSSYDSWITDVIEQIKLKFVALFVDDSDFSLGTYLIEGDKETCRQTDNLLKSIGKKHGAWVAGPNGAERSYFITFTVGYMRVRQSQNLNYVSNKLKLQDMMLRTGAIHDSLETSVTWDKCENCIENMKRCFKDEISTRGIDGIFSHRSVKRHIPF
jgi:alkyldihydroxyacetonephosphate synthase